MLRLWCLQGALRLGGEKVGSIKKELGLFVVRPSVEECYIELYKRRLREGIVRKAHLSDSRRLFAYKGGSSLINYKKDVFDSFSGE